MRCKATTPRLFIVKVGGSVITRKDEPATPKLKRMEGIALEISRIRDRLVLIHGAGSYGHPIAAKYGLKDGFTGGWQVKGVTELKSKLAELSSLFLRALYLKGVAGFPLNPANIIMAEEGRISRMEMDPLGHVMDLGFIPVLHGDLVPDSKLGFSIVSGDQIASFLAGRLKPSMVIFGCDVDGVYTGDPKKDRDARLIRSLTVREAENWGSGGVDAFKDLKDVTGGIRGKLREAASIAGLGIPVAIMNLEVEGRLLKLIRGEEVECTLIRP